MNTNELKGQDLDYWVARCEDIEHPVYLREMAPGCCLVKVTEDDETGTMSRWIAYQPSTDWLLAGPIIEKEMIDVAYGNRQGIWEAMVRPVYEYGTYMSCEGLGESESLIEAAMRAYVASKFGAEVKL